jgi:hypothetical protein
MTPEYIFIFVKRSSGIKMIVINSNLTYVSRECHRQFSTWIVNKGLRLILNYSWGTTPSISVGTEYQYVEIPWSSFGLASAPSTMNIVFNNNTGNTNTIYMDDIGYYY